MQEANQTDVLTSKAGATLKQWAELATWVPCHVLYNQQKDCWSSPAWAWFKLMA